MRLRIGHDWQVRYFQYGRGYLSADQPMLSFGLGDASAADELVVEWPNQQQQIFTNLAVCNRYEISSPPSSNTDTIFKRSDLLAGFPHVERNYDDFARQPLLPYKQSQVGPWMA